MGVKSAAGIEIPYEDEMTHTAQLDASKIGRVDPLTGELHLIEPTPGQASSSLFSFFYVSGKGVQTLEGGKQVGKSVRGNLTFSEVVRLCCSTILVSRQILLCPGVAHEMGRMALSVISATWQYRPVTSP
jgi:hypothetical protein